MKNLRSSSLCKTLAALFCVVSISAAFWSLALVGSNWDDMWSGGDYYSSNVCSSRSYSYSHLAQNLQDYRRQVQAGKVLTYSQKESMAQLESRLNPQNTNFRYRILDDSTGQLLDSNLGEEPLETLVPQVEMTTYSMTYAGDWMQGEDSLEWDEETGRQFLSVRTSEGFQRLDPMDSIGYYNQYGWYSDGDYWRDYDSDYDTRIQSADLVIEFGVSSSMAVIDDFYTDREEYYQAQGYLPLAGGVCAVSLLVSLLLVLFLCSGAGHHRGVEGISLSWQDRIPADLYAALMALGIYFIIVLGDSITWRFVQNPDPAAIGGVAVLTALIVSLCLAALVTLCARLKSHTLLRNTLVWRLCAWVIAWGKHIFAHWPVTRHPILLFLVYLLVSALTIPTVVLIPVWQGFTLWALCRWTRQWSDIRVGTQRIVGGDPSYQINTAHMYPDLREHAGQLNDLGSAINTAVEERMKSERMKSELITNVSHDLKTPLTSIINYVDLLKKQDIPDPKSQEYLEVLDRKSQRLKKLTEDLVEASKASTGNLAVNRERIGMAQLLSQAMGEYEEKCQAARLTLVSNFPKQELFVMADGRHLWRIVDNLLGNCVKYALEGTRIYLDLTTWDGNVVLSVKNISKTPLNIPPEQLMERFVRGDESRTTEGSGLGLSIARSLTELQGGIFRLAIDGDLFKATVSFPQVLD